MCLEAEVAAGLRSFSRVCHLRETACVKALLFSRQTPLPAGSCSWEVPHQGFSQGLTQLFSLISR